MASALLLGGALLPARAPAAEGTVEIMVEDAAAPWSGPDGTGYANDVVTAAFREANVGVALRVVPYARCKRAVLDGSIAACVSMTWVPEFKGRVALAKAPLILLNVDVFESPDRPLPRPPAGTCSLPPGAVVGTVLDYEYPAEIAALAKAGAKFEPSNSDYLNLKRLASGRIQAAIVVTNDLEPTDQKARDAGVEARVRWAFRCGHESGTIGFSLGHPRGRAWLERYEEGYRRLEASGALQRIAQRWTERLAAKRGAAGKAFR
ncbi:MAG: hypothetical protein QM767_26815 [Anaeromyxobacter sp.]